MRKTRTLLFKDGILAHWYVLSVLMVLGFVSVLIAPKPTIVLWLMLLAYMSNTTYSMVSRSAVRNSGLYHAFTVLLSGFIFYATLNQLVRNDLTLSLFIPYTVATVYGSFTGAKTSMRIEKFFGITVNADLKAKPTANTKKAKKILLAFLGVLAVATAIGAESIWIALVVSSLNFASSVTFALVRRSRNTSNTTYHVIAFAMNSLVWFLLFRHLVLNDMTFQLFIPYAFGSVLGGVAGQKVSQKIESILGAHPDDHLKARSNSFMPWRWMIVLGALGFVSAVVAESPMGAVFILGLALSQNIAFTLVSRSRNRTNMAYHVIASVFSNGVWFLTFRQLDVSSFPVDFYAPYAVGGAVGSITGVGVAMGIEQKLNITSD